MNEEVAQASRIEARSYYVRRRHCMVVYASFSPLYTDYYLHLMQNDLKPETLHDQLLKDALAGITLHLTSRPRDEMTAWTVNLHDPVLNLFVTGDSERGNVCGRVFTRDVKEGDVNLFFAQVTRPRSPIRQSTVEVKGQDFLAMVEQYYAQSEQLPARYFRLEDELFAMLVAQPDHDAAWFESVDAAAAARLEQDEELRLLEVRPYHFGCGCNLDLIHQVLAPVARQGLDELFQEDTHLNVQCPRCASMFRVERDVLERYLEEHPAQE